MAKTNSGPDRDHCGIGDPCHTTIIYDDNGNPSFGCGTGGADCISCSFVEAELSDFHDKHLARATQKFKQILEKIPPDPRGRKLTLIKTGKGLLLAWVHHKMKIPKGVEPVTQESIGAKSYAKALKIKK